VAIVLAAGPVVHAPEAARADAQAAGSFPVVSLEPEHRPSHRWAYVSMATGVVLVGSSFAFASHADRAYDDYLVATDTDRIESLYDEAVRYDWLARGALLGGEALIATGLYLRFIRHPHNTRVSLALEPDRVALAWRF